MDRQLLQQIWPIFSAEAREHLQSIGSGILELEKDPRAPGLLDGVRRTAHNLKGSAASLGLADKDRAIVESETGEIGVTIEIDDSVRPGVVTLPHGYGGSYAGSGPIGPAINRLTASAHCEPFTRTPYHKHVPVRIRRAIEA